MMSCAQRPGVESFSSSLALLPTWCPTVSNHQATHHGVAHPPKLKPPADLIVRTYIYIARCFWEGQAAHPWISQGLCVPFVGPSEYHITSWHNEKGSGDFDLPYLRSRT